jgi:hypothetical protein
MAPTDAGNDYDTAQICQRGHLIVASVEALPGHRADFCPQCGTATIDACPKCHTAIRGHLRGTAGHGMTGSVPVFCYSCGTPFPWAAPA